MTPPEEDAPLAPTEDAELPPPPSDDDDDAPDVAVDDDAAEEEGEAAELAMEPLAPETPPEPDPLATRDDAAPLPEPAVLLAPAAEEPGADEDVPPLDAPTVPDEPDEVTLLPPDDDEESSCVGVPVQARVVSTRAAVEDVSLRMERRLRFPPSGDNPGCGAGADKEAAGPTDGSGMFLH